MDPLEKDLVSQVGRDLVQQLAPQEVPLYRANSEAYFQNPDKALAGGKGKDEMLSFGAGQAVALLTPVVLAVLTEVVKFVAAEAKKSLQAEGASLVQESIKGMFKKFRKKDEPAPKTLSAERLAQIRTLAYEKARELRVPKRKAERLADSVVASLAVAPA